MTLVIFAKSSELVLLLRYEPIGAPSFLVFVCFCLFGFWHWISFFPSFGTKFRIRHFSWGFSRSAQSGVFHSSWSSFSVQFTRMSCGTTANFISSSLSYTIRSLFYQPKHLLGDYIPFQQLKAFSRNFYTVLGSSMAFLNLDVIVNSPVMHAFEGETPFFVTLPIPPRSVT